MGCANQGITGKLKGFSMAKEKKGTSITCSSSVKVCVGTYNIPVMLESICHKLLALLLLLITSNAALCMDQSNQHTKSYCIPFIGFSF
jgi:hypothetical protein